MITLYRNIIYIIAGAVIFFICNIVIAADNINIKSKRLSINKEDSSATFSGNVILSFQEFKLYSSSIIIYYDNDSKSQKIKKIIIPSKLKVIKNCENDIVIADHGRYNSKDKQLILEGNVNMVKNDNVLVTDKLVYLAEIETKK